MTDWATEFNHYTDEYAANAVAVWDELRERCPVAHSAAFRGMWIPTRYDDIVAIAQDTETFSSRSPLVAQYGSMADFGIVVPPISSDPPYHTEIRRMLLPFFAPGRIEALRAGIEAHCDELLDGFAAADGCDAAIDYAQHIPVRVIATMLGIPPEDGDQFRTWVVELLEAAPTNIEVAGVHLFSLFQYFGDHMEAMRARPGDDLISFLVAEAPSVIGRELQQDELFGLCLLLLLAGIDTTWSAIGASIWHLGSHRDDQARLRDDPDLWPVALEEFLRAYAPVTMAREVAHDTDFRGCPMHKGDPLLLPFPSANRDPAAFDRADEVIIDRTENRHLAFGVGIHRCLGSNLARLEVQVAVQRFVERVGPFHIADADGVRWSKGQVRGPRTLPIAFDR
ncbi:MAG TPA: cytochrome P450 [Acidimicrobiales bacterium]|nr:cytochrome P450 [Acidimicrobiales bacterium]